MNIKLAAAFFLATVSSGCVMTFPPYVEPKTNEVAIITFTENTPLIPSWFTFQDQDNCQNRLWFKRNIDEFSGTSKEYKIKGDKPFTLFSNLSHSRFNSCIAISTFTPQKGEKYDIEFIINDQNCDVVITNSINEVVHHTLKEKVTPFSETGKWCGTGQPNNVFKTYYQPIVL